MSTVVQNGMLLIKYWNIMSTNFLYKIEMFILVEKMFTNNTTNTATCSLIIPFTICNRKYMSSTTLFFQTIFSFSLHVFNYNKILYQYIAHDMFKCVSY